MPRLRSVRNFLLLMLNNNLAHATLTGPNLRTFLQGYITCDLDDLQPGTALPMAITEIKGRVVANGWVFEEEESVVLVIHTSVVDIVHQHLLPYMRFARCDLSVKPMSFYVTRYPSEGSAEFTLGSEKFTFTDQSTEAYDLDQLQIETGYALVTDTTSGKFLPQMLNLTGFDAVSFTKGCYLGQEVVARAQHRGQVKRHLHLASHDSSNLAPGDQVRTQNDDKAVIVAQSTDSALVVVSTTASENELRLVT